MLKMRVMRIMMHMMDRMEMKRNPMKTCFSDFYLLFFLALTLDFVHLCAMVCNISYFCYFSATYMHVI